MKTLDEIFYSEFCNTMQYRRAINKIKIDDIPFPSEICKPLPTRTEAICRDINIEYYKNLNFSLLESNKNATSVSIIRNKVKKKLFTNKGIPRVDENNNILTEEITVPQDSLAILSEIKIGVPYDFSTDENFKYIDFVKVNGKIQYIYIVPKKYLYELNLCAMIVGLTKLRSYYTSLAVTLITGTVVYISVIPYIPTHEKKTELLSNSARVLKTKPSANFDNEIKYLLKYWENNCIMFRRELTILREPVRGILNCALVHYDSTLKEYKMKKETSMEKCDFNEDLYTS